MAIIKTKRNTNFTTIPNALVNDSRLKWNDLGLLVYLLSKPESWAVRVDSLVKERGIGRDAVYATLKRLRDFGYARVVKYSNGSTEWTIYDEPNAENTDLAETVTDKPNTENPDLEKPDQENPDLDNPHVLVKKEVNKRKNKESKEITLSEFLIQCKENNEPAIPENDSIFEYALKVGIPHDFLSLGWIQFKSTQSLDKSGKVKKQADWRSAFRNYVKRDFLKVWTFNQNGDCYLTNLGKQLQREVA